VNTSLSSLDLLAEDGYRHEALVYSGLDEFLEHTTAFIRAGLRAREPMLVLVSRMKIDAIRRELARPVATSSSTEPADIADLVTFADMAEVGANPGRIIAAWCDFLADNVGAEAVRGIGEPIHQDRTAAELAECQLHEALLNMAFQNVPRFWLMCPHDLSCLADDVIADALRSHPFVASGRDRRPSTMYRPPVPELVFDTPLTAAPREAVTLNFGRAGLGAVRELVSERAWDFDLSVAQADELVVAINELTSNSVRHGGGQGTVRIWSESDALICEVRDSGLFRVPLAGRIPPVLSDHDGRGLWIVNQLCDLVQIRSSPNGTVVRTHMRRRATESRTG
jgi:anti-sigma regulatory factor (Ser/Thr protein kinase)